jgi:hypothetical protein
MPADGPGGKVECTAVYGFGEPSEKAGRLQLLRLHAKGGIGQVGVALDTESRPSARIAGETARRRSDAINRFLVDDLLKQFDPVNNPGGDQLTVGQLLDKAAAKLVSGASRNLEPDVEAEIRSVVGHRYEYLRADGKAEPHFSKIVLTQHPTPTRKAGALGASLAGARDGTADPAAVALLVECREALRVPLRAGDRFAAELASRQDDYLRRQGKFAEAERILPDAAKQIEQAVAIPPWGHAAARKRAADLYEAWGNRAAAANWR